MAFYYEGHILGAFSPKIETFPAISLAIRKGALVTMVPAATASVSLYTTNTAKSILGIACNAVTSSTTGTVDVLEVANGTILRCDISEIINATALTATGGSATTFVDSSLVSVEDDALIDSVWEVITMASGDKAAGYQFTATDYAVGSGTITCASLGSTGFASGDTAKMIRLGLNSSRLCGTFRLATEGTYADSIKFDQAITNGDCFRALKTTNDGKQLYVVVTAGWDATTTLTT